MEHSMPFKSLEEDAKALRKGDEGRKTEGVKLTEPLIGGNHLERW